MRPFENWPNVAFDLPHNGVVPEFRFRNRNAFTWRAKTAILFCKWSRYLTTFDATFVINVIESVKLDHHHAIMTLITALFIICHTILAIYAILWLPFHLFVCLSVCLSVICPQKLRYLSITLSYLLPNLVHINASRSYTSPAYLFI